MNNTAYAETLQRIVAAELPAATERIAVRLLAEVHPDCGYVDLSWDEFLELAGIENRGAARRHLTRLKQARIAHYDTNDYVYVTFFAWPDAPDRARGRADERVDAPKVDPDEAPNVPIRRVDALTPARPRAENGGVKAVGLGGMVINPDLDQLEDYPNQPTPTTADAPAAPDQAWVYGLLTDPEIDMLPENAVAAARLHTPAYVVRCISAWKAKTDSRGAGLLVHWLVKRPGAFRPGQVSAEFLGSALYRRHYEQVALLDDPPDWVWDLPAPPRGNRFENADGMEGELVFVERGRP